MHSDQELSQPSLTDTCLILLRHKLIFSVCCWQHRHRSSVLASARVMVTRMVVTDGAFRPDRERQAAMGAGDGSAQEGCSFTSGCSQSRSR